MSGYSASQSEISVHRKSTVAGVVDSVTFDGRRSSVEVSNLSADASAFLFFTVDGSEPVVDGSRTTLVMPGGVVEVLDTRRTNETVVKLISAIPALYSVTAAAL